MAVSVAEESAAPIFREWWKEIGFTAETSSYWDINPAYLNFPLVYENQKYARKMMYGTMWWWHNPKGVCDRVYHNIQYQSLNVHKCENLDLTLIINF